MDEIMRISDEITVMRDGEHIETRAADQMSTDEIIRLMVGRALTERYPKKTNRPGKTLLEIKGLSARSCGLSDINLTLRCGEILGVAGLDGSGRTELVESIFALRELDAGKIIINGKPVRQKTPEEAIRNGFALVTEERRRTGIFAILSILDNTVTANFKKFRTGPLLNTKRMKNVTKKSISKLRVKTPNESARIESLSGGNQQKVILARWLLTEPTVMMLDEPTRGIDVLAKYEIYKLIIDIAAEGKGVIMVSSEMSELLGLCDRIIVMSGKRIAGEVLRADATQEKIMELATKYA